jgi:putative transposase
MPKKIVRSSHRPPHIYLSDQIYFITARTYKNVGYFNSDEKKVILRDVIKRGLIRLNIGLYAYVILDNHYHLLCKINKKENLKYFVQNIHQNSSRLLRRGLSSANLDERNPVWYQYWDKCIYDEDSFFVHFNYIHHNPIKHGYVRGWDDLLQYKFSTYNQWLISRGEEFMENTLLDYPINDYSFE